MPDEGTLLSSAAAARALGVGVSSVKRWTDEGELESIRTPGGHRRYTTRALYRFAALRDLRTDRLPAPKEPPPQRADITLFDALVKGDRAAVEDLVNPRVSSLAKRATFLDRVVGDALREIGYRWERGTLSVEQEHRASHMIADAVDRLRPQKLNGRGKRVVLVCPPDEWHELPLRLVRLIFEWSGWQTEMHGASLPWPESALAVSSLRPAMIAFSARSREPFQSDEFRQLVQQCRKRGTTVIVGGEWARGGLGEAEGYYRFRTLRGFERWLRER